jgi:N-sulfoglucosamine sulfohydrolase
VDAAANGMAPAGCELTDLLADKPIHDRGSIFLGQERHDYGRPRNQGYPIRSIIEDGYLYIYNFKPELWPAGNPETGYLNTDGSPTKTSILESRRRTSLWELSFGKHSAEELYHIESDRACMHNLAEDPAYTTRKERMRERLFEHLRATGDPRVCGNGDIFDSYPFYQPTSFDFYERYMRGEATSGQTDWVNPTDYEPAPLD